MARKHAPKIEYIKTFRVFWWPIGATEAVSMLHLDMDHAKETVATLERDFAQWPGHNPDIHIVKGETRADF